MQQATGRMTPRALHERIIDDLGREIVSGGLKPGDRQDQVAGSRRRRTRLRAFIGRAKVELRRRRTRIAVASRDAS